MILTELHDILPPKLFSKHLGETINKLLTDTTALGIELADVRIIGANPTSLCFLALGGEVEDGAANPEVRDYMKKVKKLAIKTFQDAKIQVPLMSVRYQSDPAGDAEISVCCMWDWKAPDPKLNAVVLKAAIDDDFEAEVEL